MGARHKRPTPPMDWERFSQSLSVQTQFVDKSPNLLKSRNALSHRYRISHCVGHLWVLGRAGEQGEHGVVLCSKIICTWLMYILYRSSRIGTRIVMKCVAMPWLTHPSPGVESVSIAKWSPLTILVAVWFRGIFGLLRGDYPCTLIFPLGRCCF